ncbi:MAG TPA: sensor domain-containing diguanylate cyclase [Planctomycetaceae bacterium]|nr:sensor domain-containing diguanylate cyclase [Planctomycetaceae bacterium]
MPVLLGPQPNSLDMAIAQGNLVALAIVCLLQYSYSLYRISRVRRIAAQYRDEVDHLSLEMLQLERERMVHRLENQILREVLTQTQCRKALHVLLKRYVPNPEDAFAAFILFDAINDPITHARGLHGDSIESLVVPEDVREQLRQHGAVLWETPTPGNCPLVGSLHSADRRKVRFLAAVAAKDERGLLGVMVTSALLPFGTNRVEQIELSTRLMQAIAPNLRQTLELEQQTSQLQCTREMLELRSIIDSRFDQPMRMIEAFLTRLCDLVRGDAVRLFLHTRDPDEELRSAFRTGVHLQAGVMEPWLEHEERLARCGNTAACLLSFDRPQLLQIGVDSLIGSAMTAPVIQNGTIIGIVCVTRKSADRPTAAHRQLLVWSAETLSHSIARALSVMAIERQARQDGLTELANRRTFEAQLAREFSAIRKGTLADLSLLLLDLDRFKTINDLHGHQGGDEVLRAAARILRDLQSRHSALAKSMAARYGGEELALILPGLNQEQAIEVAEEYRAALERQVIQHHAVGIHVTVSIGVASFPQHGHQPDDLIAAADTALYRAKDCGRNRVECGPPEAVLR